MEKGGIKALIIVLVILIIVAGVVLGQKIIKDREAEEPTMAKQEENVVEEPEGKTVYSSYPYQF